MVLGTTLNYPGVKIHVDRRSSARPYGAHARFLARHRPTHKPKYIVMKETLTRKKSISINRADFYKASDLYKYLTRVQKDLVMKYSQIKNDDATQYLT